MGIRNTVLAAVQPTLNDATSNQRDKTPAEFYLNIGFETNDPQFPFVDLPKAGIALDKIEKHQIFGDATPYKSFLAMQNALVDTFLERAQQLAPGETAIVSIDEDSGLAMQIRRVSNKAEMPTVVAEIQGIKLR